MDGFGDAEFMALLNITALFIALLMPSSELGLMKPAASPIRNIPFLPVQNPLLIVGRKTRHASVFIGLEKSNPNCLDVFLCLKFFSAIFRIKCSAKY